MLSLQLQYCNLPLHVKKSLHARIIQARVLPVPLHAIPRYSFPVTANKSLSTSSVTVLVKLIERRIYLIRGHKVMVDVDLAELCGVPTKRLNEQVRRNRKRFLKDFMFRLTTIEADRRHLSNLKPFIYATASPPDVRRWLCPAVGVFESRATPLVRALPLYANLGSE